MARGPTLRQIAKKLGVNVSTVSRALGGDPGVGRRRAEEIRALAASLGYRPQPVRRKRSGAIGLLVATDTPGRPDDYFQQRVIVLVADESSKRGLHLHVEFVPRDERPKALPAIVDENRVDGVLLSGHPHASLCSRIKKLGLPAGVIHDSASRTGLDCVTVSVEDAMRTAVSRLVAFGCRTLAYVASDVRYPTVAARVEAFRSAAKSSSLGARACRVMDGFGTGLGGGRDVVARLVEKDRLSHALLFQNDVMAIGAMYELARRGTEVPREISILGYDDIVMAKEIAPALSSFDQGEREAVAAALDLLRERVDDGGGPARERAIAARLVWRDSCGPREGG